MALITGVPITVAEFKDCFDRDFTFGTSIADVRDKDIERALNEGVGLFNSDLWDTVDQKKAAYQYLAAHFLVINIKAAGGVKKTGRGINSTGSFPLSNKSAGPLSVGYAIPNDLADNPILAQFNKTEYGQKYLMLLQPQLVGYMDTVEGGTNP